MIRRSIPRRDVLKIGLAGVGVAAPRRPPAWGRSPVKATQVTAVLYAAHLVAEAGGYFKKEGVDVELLTSPAGARSAQMLAAARSTTCWATARTPQRLTEQGKPTVILFVTDQKCPYANIQTRKDLHRGGLTSIDKLATMKPKDGGKWKAGATAVGSGTWMYGNFILRSHPIGGGKTLNDLVEWIGVGGVKSALGRSRPRRSTSTWPRPRSSSRATRRATARCSSTCARTSSGCPSSRGPSRPRQLRAQDHHPEPQGRDAGLRHRGLQGGAVDEGGLARGHRQGARALRRHHGAHQGVRPQGARVVQAGVDVRPRVHRARTTTT